MSETSPPTSMKAVAWTAYGPPEVLQIAEVATPRPKAREVLIKVHATTVTAGDCEVRRFEIAPLFWPFLRLYTGILKPKNKILGQELAGEVVAVGKDVTRFSVGDAVFAATMMRMGAYADYACLPESYPMALKPSNMTLEEAATIPTGGLNGLHFLQAAQVQSGEQVLINGAGGSIGTYAIQIAKAWGAEVTAVDSAEKLEMLRSIGADHVIDYSQEDFTQGGRRYDVIIDIVGKSSFSQSLQCLTPKGRYVLGNPSLSGMLRGLWASRTSDKKVISALAGYSPEEVAQVCSLIEAGAVKAVIDRRYPLEQIAEAHRYVEAGHKQGNVVVTV